MTKSIKMIERLRVATLATFVSGFINAYTYITQNGSFAGVQSGNLLLLAISIAQGAWEKLITYLIPLLFFCLGQGVSYGLRKRAKYKGYRWHIYVSGVLIVLMLIIALFSPLLPSYFTLAGLALFASIKVDTLLRHSFYTLLVLLSCMAGAIIGTALTNYFSEYSLYFLLLSLLLLYFLVKGDGEI